MHPLAEKVLARDTRATARVCRLVDDRAGDFVEILRDLFPHTGRAWLIGVTGNPGAGKSTLTDRLIGAFRKQDRRVAVVAVDPTSPFTGGAILGDRIRMQAHFGDPDVFIRSLATRGALGGLSRSAADIARILDVWGADVVLVETVGVGQDELEITRMAHTTLVVTAPGMGDEVQAIKAGILECADVFAVNKADRDGADAAVRDLELMIALGGEVSGAGSRARGHSAAAAFRFSEPDEAPRDSEGDGAAPWQPAIARTVATRNEGVTALVEQLERHRAWLFGTSAGALRREQRLREAMHVQLRDALTDAAVVALGPALEEAVQSVARRELDPYTASQRLIEAFRAGSAAT